MENDKFTVGSITQLIHTLPTGGQAALDLAAMPGKRIKELEAEVARLKGIIESSPGGVFVTNRLWNALCNTLAIYNNTAANQRGLGSWPGVLWMRNTDEGVIVREEMEAILHG